MSSALRRLLQTMVEQRASDLYLSAGAQAQLRVDGVNRTLPFEPDETGLRNLLTPLVSQANWGVLHERGELNFGHEEAGLGAFRFSLFRQRARSAAVVRHIPAEVPSLQALGLPPVLAELALARRGLVLVGGATGSGKSTTLAAMVDHRNARQAGHIITFEDPIEFRHANRLSLVHQREIGIDCESLQTALRNALRQAPDCIVIGEIRDGATMSSALEYAQSGHLVLASVHANNAWHGLSRVLAFHAPENRAALLADLAVALRAVVAQRLLPAAAGPGRVVAVEVMLNGTHVAELIHAGRINELREAMRQSLAPGSVTFDQALLALVQAGRVTREEALSQADSPTDLLWQMQQAAPDTGVADQGGADFSGIRLDG